MSCTEASWAELPEADKRYAASGEVPTHRCPSYSTHPRTGDEYPGINKPVAVADWLANTDVTEDYILVIDADMIMRRPVLPHEMGALPGTAVSGFFGYMVGVHNELALRHVPEVEPRWDEVAGPPGRRGDQVGGFTLMYRDDLRRVAPLWLKISEDVRADPLAWNLTGDVYASPDIPPWIAEMYGYSFGCSKAGVWHIADHTFQLYPGYAVLTEHWHSPPRVLHYGILWSIASGPELTPPGDPSSLYTFEKHWHMEFDALACPPWELSDDSSEGKSGLFAHPPSPAAFNTTGDELYRDLLAVQVIVTLNEAFCERHRRNCPPSEQLEQECRRAEVLARELEESFAALQPPQTHEGDEAAGAEGEAAAEAEQGETAAEAEESGEAAASGADEAGEAEQGGEAAATEAGVNEAAAEVDGAEDAAAEAEQVAAAAAAGLDEAAAAEAEESGAAAEVDQDGATGDAEQRSEAAAGEAEGAAAVAEEQDGAAESGEADKAAADGEQGGEGAAADEQGDPSALGQHPSPHATHDVLAITLALNTPQAAPPEGAEEQTRDEL